MAYKRQRIVMQRQLDSLPGNNCRIRANKLYDNALNKLPRSKLSLSAWLPLRGSGGITLLVQTLTRSNKKLTQQAAGN